MKKPFKGSPTLCSKQFMQILDNHPTAKTTLWIFLFIMLDELWREYLETPTVTRAYGTACLFTTIAIVIFINFVIVHIIYVDKLLFLAIGPSDTVSLVLQP